MKELRVELGDRAYPVYVGEGLLERAHELIPPQPRAEKIALFGDEVLFEENGQHTDRLTRGVAPLELMLRRFPARGEESKSVAKAEWCWRALAVNGFHRNDLAVAFGGGVVCDLAGFVAATYHRGMSWVAVPTTLLAMVDASIGGKTAIDVPEAKNLIGAFHQPRAVIADVATLATLPDGVFRTGMAEVIKHALLADAELHAYLHAWRDPILSRDPERLTEMVVKAAAVKVDIVSRDETDQGPRAHLNYGHTLGHALETLGEYRRFSHGEAVSIGMMFAAYLARGLGYADRVGDHRAALEAYGLPTRGTGATLEEVGAIWARDKKYERGVRFVVLEDLGKPTLVRDFPEKALREAYEAVT